LQQLPWRALGLNIFLVIEHYPWNPANILSAMTPSHPIARRESTGAFARDLGSLWPVALGVSAAAFTVLAGMRVWMVAELGWSGAYPGIYYHLMAAYDWLGAGISVASLLVAWRFLPRGVGVDVARWLAEHRFAVSCLVTVAMVILANLVCGGLALTQDEFAPLTQARVFAAGKIAGEWPPDMMNLLLPKIYWNWFFVKAIDTGRFISNYSPGHAILIAPFARLGVETASNAVISGLALLAIASIAGRMQDGTAGGAAMLLTLASPAFWAYGLGFYSMPAHLLVNMLYVLLMMQRSLVATAAAGTIGGFGLSLHNPFPHAVFAAPWILALACEPRRWIRIPLLALGYAVVYVPLALGWDDYKDAIRHETMVAQPAENPAAAAPQSTDSWLERIYAYPDQVRSAFAFEGAWPVFRHRLFALLKLIAWDAPALVVLASWAAFRNRHDRLTRLLAASAIVTFLGYTFVRFSGGHGWGYRYFFPTWGVLPILAGAAAAGSGTVPRAAQVILTAAVVAGPLAVPVRLWQIHGFYAAHFSVEPVVPSEVVVLPEFDPRRSLVFINPSNLPFRRDLVQNDPFLRTGPIRMNTTGDEVSALVARGLAAERTATPVLVTRNPNGCVWYLLPQQLNRESRWPPDVVPMGEPSP